MGRMDLSGRAALITGGKRIGAAVAEHLARAGADVALTYRGSKADAEETAEVVRGIGRRAQVIRADLSLEEDCGRVVDDVVSAWGRLDVLVNMASLYRSVSVDELTLADWNAQMNVDLRAAWLCAQAAVPHMRRLRGGRIINFSDWLAASRRPRKRTSRSRGGSGRPETSSASVSSIGPTIGSRSRRRATSFFSTQGRS